MPFVGLAEQAQLDSPDGSLRLLVSIENGVITYSLEKLGSAIINQSRISLKTSKHGSVIFQSKPSIEIAEVSQIINPLWGITKTISDSFKQLTIGCSSDLFVEFRVYNEGIAWRFNTRFDEEIQILDELAEFVLPNDAIAYFPETKGFSTPFEPNYLPMPIGTIGSKQLAQTPIMFKLSNGSVTVISDVNLFEYPGMFLEKSNENSFTATFPRYPKRESQQILGRLKLVKWPQLSKMVVRSTNDFIAKTHGNRSYPWRVVMVSSNDLEILNNNLVFQLAQEAEMDFSWVKPGKVVWDWYHNWNLQGVDFKAGINTQTYLYMIDFAARNGIEYVNIDDGWSKLWSFKKINKNLDLDEVMRYAKEKNVGIFIWVMWNTLEKNLLANLDWFQQLGVAGLKVDFFDRCDQRMVDFINLLAHECAKRNLLLNLHGMYKPTGINRTFPNVVNIEGVLGLEYNKFSNRCTPEHNLTIPFVRNITGPMDYTPGAMRYMRPDEFKKSWDNPHAMTTRAQQLAMYVVYHGGVQMLADSPTFYEQDQVSLNFISEVPVTWDESVPLSGKIGECIVIARRKGGVWYLGGMAGVKPQSLSFSLSFIDSDNAELTLITDGNGLDDVAKRTQKVSKDQIITIDIVEGGGFVGIIKPN